MGPRRTNAKCHGVITIRDGKIVNWRDYLNRVAVFAALGWPSGR